MDTDGEKVYLFGGLGSSSKERFNELWTYNLKDGIWTLIEPHGDIPTPRYCCTMNAWQDKMVCFGGFGDGDRLNTVHVWSKETMEWKFLVTNGELPEKRSHHTGTVSGNRLIVFGGLSQEGKRLNDIHVLDLTTLTWSQLEVRGTLPSPRLGHSCVMLGSKVMIVFGGYGGPEGHTKYNEINLLHFDTMMWTQPIIQGRHPPPMYAHRALAVGAEKMIVFGGDTGSGSRILSNEVWIFDLGTLRWTQVGPNGGTLLGPSSMVQLGSNYGSPSAGAQPSLSSSSTISFGFDSSSEESQAKETQNKDSLAGPAIAVLTGSAGPTTASPIVVTSGGVTTASSVIGGSGSETLKEWGSGFMQPPPRSHFGATICQGHLVIFGGSGRGESEKLNDIWAFNLFSLDQLQTMPFESLKAEIDSATESVPEEVMKMLSGVEGSSKELRWLKKNVLDQCVQPALSELKAQFERVVHEKESFAAWKEDELMRLEEQEAQVFAVRPQHLTNIAQSKSTGKVKLNVGGVHFDTTLATLTRDPSSLLAAMFSGRYPLTDDPSDQHAYFIDRDPLHFRYCLNFLRDNFIALPPNRALHLELLREASFYQISSLVDFLRTALRKLDVALEPNGPEAEKERMKGKSKIIYI
jgi:hypothetical protein